MKVDGDVLSDGKKLCLMDHPYDELTEIENTEEQVNEIFEAESKGFVIYFSFETCCLPASLRQTCVLRQQFISCFAITYSQNNS